MNQIEESAGGLLMDASDEERGALLIRVRSRGFEIPKGHIEEGEGASEAAVRELREETNLLSAIGVGALLGTLEYEFLSHGHTIRKRVLYFAMRAPGALEFGPRPPRTRELRWVKEEEAYGVELVNEDLRPLLLAALRGE